MKVRERKAFLAEQPLGQLFDIKSYYQSELAAEQKEDEHGNSLLTTAGATGAGGVALGARALIEAPELIAIGSNMLDDYSNIRSKEPKKTPAKPRLTGTSIAAISLLAAGAALGTYWAVKQYKRHYSTNELTQMKETVKDIDKEIKHRKKQPDTQIAASSLEAAPMQERALQCG